MTRFNIFCRIFSLIIIYLSSLLSYGQTNTIASLTDLGTRYDFAYSIAIQEDEKVVIAGDADGTPFILRFDTRGVLDPTFGSNGKVFATWTCSSNPADNDIKIQSDGKIVLGTRYYNGSDDDFIVARYNIDGSPDLSFGNQGQVITKIGNYNDWCNCVIIQSDDKILAGGAMNNSANSDYNYDFALVRYNSDGSLDTSFGMDGKVRTHIGLSNNMAHSMAIQQNGKIILAGEANDSIFSDFALTRYNPDGTLDTSFGKEGVVRTALSPWYDYARSVLVQSDEKILVAGSAQSDLSNTNFALLRYFTDGTLDSTFGTNGTVITDVGNDYGNSLTLQSDHKIVLAGSTAAGTIYDYATLRYNMDGSPDNSFGTNGLIRTSFGDGDSEGLAAAVRSNGEIIIAGIYNHGSPLYFDIALLRLFSYLTSVPSSPALSLPPNGAAEQLTNPTLIWNSVTEASNYNLQVSPTEEFESLIVNEAGLISVKFGQDH
jgi:uncharacterized delta-60 repeat protein